MERGKASEEIEQAREEMVKYVNGLILRDGVEVRRRWAEYFEQVLNVADIREANIHVVGNWRMPVLGDLNENNIVGGSRGQGRLTINNTYTHREFKLKFSALLKDYDFKYAENSKKNILKYHCF